MLTTAANANAIELVLGYTGTLLNDSMLDWWGAAFSSTTSVTFAYDFVNNNATPAPPNQKAQAMFSGSAFAPRGATMLTLIPPATGAPPSPPQATIAFSIIGTYTDTTTGAGPFVYTADNPLVVTFPVKLITQNGQPPSASTLSGKMLTSAFGNASWSSGSLIFLDLIAEPTAPRPTVTAAMTAAAAAKKSSNAAVVVPQNLPSCMAQWFKTVFTEMAILSLAQSFNHFTGTFLIPIGYTFEVLPAGTTSGGQSVGPSLMVGAGIQHGVPSPMSAIVPDAGALFSVNQLMANGATSPFTWEPVPSAILAIAPKTIAQMWVANINANSDTQTALTNALSVVSDSGANWTIGTTKFSYTSPAVLDPATNSGLCMNYNVSNTSTGNGTFSTASVNDAIAFTVGWQVNSANTPIVNVAFTRTFSCSFNGLSPCFIQTNGDVSIPWTVTFTMSNPSTVPGLTFAGDYYTNQFTTGAVSDSYYGYQNANNALVTTTDNFQPPIATMLQALGGCSSLTTLADINGAAANPKLDAQFRVNMLLTPIQNS